MLKMVFLLLTILACGCQSLQPLPFPSNLTERATLKLEIDGNLYQGIASIRRKSSYKFKVLLPQKTRELVVRSCHREIFINPTGGVVNYSYIPVTFLENWGACLVTISAHLEAGGREFALIDFSSNETLSATLYCNGGKQTGTTTLCQAPEDSIQMVVFDKAVKSKTGEGCPSLDAEPLSESNAYRQYITVSQGYCVYAFYDGRNVHRLVLYGY